MAKSLRFDLNTIGTMLKIVGPLAFLSACAPVVSNPSPLENLRVKAEPLEPRDYRIAPGDEIEVKFFSASDLDDRVVVRPDGKISLMFSQSMVAAGKTPDELAGDIKRKLKPYMRQSDLVVIMRSFINQRAYVGGEVAKPGPVSVFNAQNLLQIIDEAGWITPTGSTSEVVLVRRDEEGKDAVYSLDISKIISGEDVSQNVTIMPGDIVLVPPSGITRFDRWIDQNVRQAVPLNSSVVITNQYTTH